MEKKSTNDAVKGRRLPASVIRATEDMPPSIEVEQVLEHISSPYRWELLEAPLTRPKKMKVVRQKSGHAK